MTVLLMYPRTQKSKKVAENTYLPFLALIGQFRIVVSRVASRFINRIYPILLLRKQIQCTLDSLSTTTSMDIRYMGNRNLSVPYTHPSPHSAVSSASSTVQELSRRAQKSAVQPPSGI